MAADIKLNTEENLTPEEVLAKAEEELSDSDESNEVPPLDIVAFSEHKSCADLLRLFKSGKLKIEPDYQREIVWPAANQTRFIDSLAKRLPIPSMCISLDYRTDKREVVDGLQRIASIIKFLDDREWRLSKLDDIDPRISNKTVEYLENEESDLYERVRDTSIPVTVIRCDLSKRSHQEYLFTIFHRLNTGGAKLSNQEIRNCIYNGPFNNLLKAVVSTPEYKTLFNIIPNKKYRYSNEEMVLRILSHVDDPDLYKAPLTKHLNSFMSYKKDIDETVSSNVTAIVLRAINIVYTKVFNSEPMPKLSKATIEALFVGVIANIDDLEKLDKPAVRGKYDLLIKDELFSVQALSEGLSATEKVKARIARSTEIFG